MTASSGGSQTLKLTWKKKDGHQDLLDSYLRTPSGCELFSGNYDCKDETFRVQIDVPLGVTSETVTIEKSDRGVLEQRVCRAGLVFGEAHSFVCNGIVTSHHHVAHNGTTGKFSYFVKIVPDKSEWSSITANVKVYDNIGWYA